VISDNASTDSTPDICREYAARDARVRYLRQPVNTGIIGNLEWALSSPTSEYFLLIGDDDMYQTTYLEKMVGILDAHANAAVAYSNFNYITPQGDIRPSGLRFFDAPGAPSTRVFGGFLRRRPCLPMMMGLFRSDLVRGALPLQRFSDVTADVDNLFLLKMFSSGYGAAGLDEVLFSYRLKERSNTWPAGYPTTTAGRWWWALRHNVEFTGRVWRILDHSRFSAVQRVLLKARAVGTLGVLFGAQPLLNAWRRWSRANA
jgi:glycosyltransferase involved in cell wall biosynthesis